MSTTFSPVEVCIQHFQEGNMIIVMDDEDRENEGDLFLPAQYADQKKVAFFLRHTTGILCTAMPSNWAKRLELPLMVTNNTDTHKTAFTVTCDHKDAGTGVSAASRTKTILALADPNTSPSELNRPGHMFPLIAKDRGVLERRGHTEACVDLCKLSGCNPVGLLSELCDDDGNMMRLPACIEFSKKYDIPILSIQQLVEYRTKQEIFNSPTLSPLHISSNGDNTQFSTSSSSSSSPSTPTSSTSAPSITSVVSALKQKLPVDKFNVSEVAQCSLPIGFGDKFLGSWDTRIFVSNWDGVHHTVLIKGDINSVLKQSSAQEILVRIHSECFTGNTLGSLKCDCGAQFQMALGHIHQHHQLTDGVGILIWVGGHEGRGIGFVNKIKAYQLQDKLGLDTYEANKKLGFPEDSRDYSAPLKILQQILQPGNVLQPEHTDNSVPQTKHKLVLLSNNPHKFTAASAFLGGEDEEPVEQNDQLHSSLNSNFEVVSQPLLCPPTPYSQKYLESKRKYEKEVAHQLAQKLSLEIEKVPAVYL